MNETATRVLNINCYGEMEDRLLAEMAKWPKQPDQPYVCPDTEVSWIDALANSRNRLLGEKCDDFLWESRVKRMVDPVFQQEATKRDSALLYLKNELLAFLRTQLARWESEAQSVEGKSHDSIDFANRALTRTKARIAFILDVIAESP